MDLKYLAKDFEDRDKKALNNKIPVGEENDWKLPLIIEEFARRNIQPLQLAPAVAPGSETLAHDFSKSTSSRRLEFCCSINIVAGLKSTLQTLWFRTTEHVKVGRKVF